MIKKLAYLAVTYFVTLTGINLQAASGSWNVDGSGDWNVNANWTANFPNGNNDDATLGDRAGTLGILITSPTTITIRDLIVSAGDDTYTITGDTLTIRRNVVNNNVNNPLTISNNLVFANGPNNFNGNGTNIIFGNTSGNVVMNLNAGQTVFNGTVSNSANINVTGGSHIFNGSTRVQGNNNDFTVTGGSVVVNGNLIIAGNGGSELLISGGTSTFNGTVAIQNGGDFAISGGTATFNNSISGTGEFNVSGNGTAILTGVNTNFTGSFVVAAENNNNTARLTGNTAAFNNRNINIGGGGNATRTNILTFNQGTDGTYSGVISGGGNNTKFVVKEGAGVLTLSGANTFTGTISNNQGTISVSANDNLGAAANVVVMSNEAILQSTADITMTRNFTLGGGGGGVFSQDAGTTLTLNGVISGAGALQKNGTGTLALGGANTFTGPLTINAGTLTANGGAAIADTVAVTVNAGGALNLGASETIGSLAGAGDVTLGANTLTTGGDNTSTTFSGVMSGTGALVKNGTGTMILSGANTYSGGTTVNAGTLQGDTTSLQGNIVNDATVEFNQAGDGTYAGAMSGTGALIKNGAGAVTLTGANIYSGNTTINGGAIIAGAANVFSPNSDVTVAAAGIYSLNNFNQTIQNLVNNGTVTLGTAQLTANNYSGTGILNIAINSTTVFGQLSATTANISGTTLNLTFGGPFIPQGGDTFQVVTTTGGVTGTFAAINGPAAVQFAQVNDGNNLNLNVATVVVTGITDYVTFGQTPNQRAVAGALDFVRPNASGDMATIIGTLNTLDANGLRIAFDQISPIQYASMPAFSFSYANVQFLNMGSRFAEIRQGRRGFSGNNVSLYDNNGRLKLPRDGYFAGTDLVPVSAVRAAERFANTPDNPWGFFASGSGTFGDQKSVTSAAGLQPGYDFTTAGMTLGADYQFGQNFVLGLYGGYASGSTTLDGNGSTVSANSGRFGLYATYFTGGFYANGSVGGAYNSYESERRIIFPGIDRKATASPDGYEFNTSGGLGYDFTVGKFTLGSSASVQYNRVEVNSFTENNAGALNLALNSQTAESLRSYVGGRAAYTWEVGKITLLPEVAAFWQREYLDDARTINAQFAGVGGSSFGVQTAQAGRNGALVSAGVSAFWTDKFSTYINYGGELGRSDYSSHSVMGGFRYEF